MVEDWNFRFAKKRKNFYEEKKRTHFQRKNNDLFCFCGLRKAKSHVCSVFLVICNTLATPATTSRRNCLHTEHIP